MAQVYLTINLKKFFTLWLVQKLRYGSGSTIAQSIIMQNSGLIECTSKKRETIFTIVLPVKSNVNE